MMKWLKAAVGLSAMEERNRRKAGKLYDYLDDSPLFKPVAAKDSRSRMNVTSVTGHADLDKQFISAATAAGFDGLKGHRSVGGMRASIYNAFPPEGVDALLEFMQEFETKHS